MIGDVIMSDYNTYKAKVEKTIWQGESAIRFRAGGYEALLLPGVGAQIIELKDLKRGLDLLRKPDDIDLEAFKARPQVYGIPILFPPNRIEDGKFQATGRILDFPINDVKGNNHIHGFLRTRTWEITKMAPISEETVEIEVVFNGDQANDSYAQYLNQFELTLQYILSSAGLKQKLTIINNSGNSLPMGVGFHTAFKVPFHPGSKEQDYRLKVSVDEEWELTERILPTGKLLPLNVSNQDYRTQGILPQGTLISGHFTAKEITIDNKPFHGAIIDDESKGLRLIYKVGKEYKHWMIWNDTGKQGFICPEPQTWVINAPNVKLPPEITGYRILKPGETWAEESSIYIEEIAR
jgi:aldose 1-epimerase